MVGEPCSPPPAGHLSPGPHPPRSRVPFLAGMRGTRRPRSPCAAGAAVPGSAPLSAPASWAAWGGVPSSRPSLLLRPSAWKSAFAREINFSPGSAGVGGPAASTWLGSNWAQRSWSERVAAGWEPEGPEDGRPRGRGPGAGAGPPGQVCGSCSVLAKPSERERRWLPVGWPRALPAAGAPVPLPASLTLRRPRACRAGAWEGRPLPPPPRVRPTRAEREPGWPLAGPDCPEPGPAAWKSPGLRPVGNGFLAPQPNCSTFWSDSSRRSRSRAELRQLF